MDPLSIVTSCAGLVSAIATISKAVTQLTSELRDAKGELGRVGSELTSLQVPLRHIGNRAQASSDSGVPIAADLQTQIQDIVDNCRTVVEEIGRIVEKCSARRRGTRSVAWVVVRGDVNRLRSSLESHKMALNIAVSLVESEISKAIQDNTYHIRSQVTDIRSRVGGVQSDTTRVRTQNTQILGEIRSLKELLPQETVTNDQILDAIQILMSRLSIDAPSGSIPLQEHLRILRGLTQEQATPDDVEPWVDWVAGPRPEHDPSSLSITFAIDYGVSLTSAAFATSYLGDLNVKLLERYQGSGGDYIAPDVPSVIAYASENTSLSQDVWGYLVEPEMKCYSGTELLLDDQFTGFDESRSGFGSKSFGIPEGKTVKDVVADYLRSLHQVMVDVFSNYFDAQLLSEFPIAFWLTVPATRSDRAKNLLKEAAIQAGLLSKPSDSVLFARETEAVAYAAFKSDLKRPDALVRPGTSVVICHCGDSTADVTACKIQSLEPLKLKEICVGIGGNYGIGTVKHNFEKLMNKRFGYRYRRLGVRERDLLMSRFEICMMGFTAEDLRCAFLDGDIWLESSEYYQHGCVILRPVEDIRPLFEPAIEGISSLLSEQTNEAKERGAGPVERLVLYGAFASIPYVRDRLSAWCSAREIQLTQLQTPVPVVEGAVLLGSDAQSRRHLGFGTSKLYNSSDHSGYDEANMRMWRNRSDNDSMYLSGFITWIVKKWVPISDDSEFDSSFILCIKHTRNIGEKLSQTRKLTLYECMDDCPPETTEDSSVRKVLDIEFSFGKLKLSALASRVVDNERWYSVTVLVNIQFSTGSMVFRVSCQDKEIGSCRISY
ncbi:Fc.00g090460.m01.CDS01 [Cosmosporella sp. VM-42]